MGEQILSSEGEGVREESSSTVGWGVGRPRDARIMIWERWRKGWFCAGVTSLQVGRLQRSLAHAQLKGGRSYPVLISSAPTRRKRLQITTKPPQENILLLRLWCQYEDTQVLKPPWLGKAGKMDLTNNYPQFLSQNNLAVSYKWNIKLSFDQQLHTQTFTWLFTEFYSQ